MVGVDIVGYDIDHQRRSSPESCFGFCLWAGGDVLPQQCTAATWTPQDNDKGTCYFKDTKRKGVPTTPKAEAETFFTLVSSDRTFIWSETKVGFDMAGFDIDNKQGKGMAECMQHCNANSNCYAVTWTNYQGGWCWLKNRASGYVAKAGAQTAFVARKIDRPH